MMLRSGGVAHIGQGDPVAIGAGHAVRAAGAGIGAGAAGKARCPAPRSTSGVQRIVQRQAHGRAGGGDMLEAGGGGQAQWPVFRLLHQLPGVERIQKVDVARAAVQDLRRAGRSRRRM